MDQVLRYDSWRGTKTAILLFNRGNSDEADSYGAPLKFEMTSCTVTR